MRPSFLRYPSCVFTTIESLWYGKWVYNIIFHCWTHSQTQHSNHWWKHECLNRQRQKKMNFVYTTCQTEMVNTKQIPPPSEDRLAYLNTKFQKRKGKLWTYTNPNNCKEQLNYILMNKKWRNRVLGYETYYFLKKNLLITKFAQQKYARIYIKMKNKQLKLQVIITPHLPIVI